MIVYLSVLAYSVHGVYIGISNKYAETIIDLNTTTGVIHEVSHNVMIDEKCTYQLSYQELAVCREFFLSLLN
ncbi:hypothetical protein D3C87_1534050 [compost metagenome]